MDHIDNDNMRLSSFVLCHRKYLSRSEIHLSQAFKCQRLKVRRHPRSRFHDDIIADLDLTTIEDFAVHAAAAIRDQGILQPRMKFIHF